MNDPYRILGVSPTASDEEVKKAYYELARKYHPDNYSGSDLKDLAEKKMKEINEAYDQIKRIRAESGASHSGGANSGSSYGGALSEARRLITLGNYSNAEIILDSMSAGERNGEWHYLKACILLKRGAFFDARRHIDEACRLDPQNADYANARNTMDSGSGIFGNEPSGTSSASVCDVCCAFLCADSCCECMGGDLIPCC